MICSTLVNFQTHTQPAFEQLIWWAEKTELTLSPPIPLRLYTLPYWSNPPFFNFWHSGALALGTERQSARMSKIKNGGVDQYGAGPFEQQQFGTAGVERVNRNVADMWRLLNTTFLPDSSRSYWWPTSWTWRNSFGDGRLHALHRLGQFVALRRKAVHQISNLVQLLLHLGNGRTIASSRRLSQITTISTLDVFIFTHVK